MDTRQTCTCTLQLQRCDGGVVTAPHLDLKFTTFFCMILGDVAKQIQHIWFVLSRNTSSCFNVTKPG